MTGAGIAAAVFVGWALAVAWSDIRYRRVSNHIVLAGFAVALSSGITRTNPFGIQIDSALAGALLGLVAFLPLYATRAMGAADVKVFATLGAWCGAGLLLQIWLVASLLAAAHVVLLLVITRTPVRAALRVGATMTLGRYRSTPYAACCTAVAILLLYGGPLLVFKR
jgi:prepilin peptidase CpaA